MNALKALAVACLTLVLASTSGSDLLSRISYTLLAVTVICFVWSAATFGWVAVRREPRALRAQVGETLEEKLTVTNRSFWPKLWLEVRDQSTLPGYQPSRVISLGPSATASWLSSARCRRRGEYRLGPLHVSASDPFRLFRWSRQVVGPLPVIIYPATVDLGGFSLSSGYLMGGANASSGPLQPTTSVGGVRDYVPGDPLSRIHWLSTARSRRFIVKEFEFDPTSEVWLVLDLDAEVQLGEGDDSTVEHGVVVVASIARCLLEQNRAVGLVVNDHPLTVMPLDRGPRQLMRILDRLAVVQPDGQRTLAELLLAEASRFDRDTTALVVTPSLDSTWPAALKQATRRGARSQAVLLEPASFGGECDGTEMVSALASANVPTYTLRLGDQLAEALARPATSGVV